MMGFLLLLSAAYFARRFVEGYLGDDAFWWMLFGIVAAAALFLLVRTFQFARTNVGRLAAAVLAIVMLVPSGVYAYRLTHPPIDWKSYSPQALDEARKSGKPVLVEFTAAWCGNCLALEATVFHDPRTVETIKTRDVVALRADLTRDDAPGWTLLRQLSPVAAIPLTAVYLPAQPEPVKLNGLFKTDDLVSTLSTPAPPQTP
jgi:thiol:disulfide interchange protein DsbD